MKTMMKTTIALLTALTASLTFASDAGLAEARAAQLAHKAPRVLPARVVRTAGKVADAANLLSLDGKSATLTGGAEKPVVVLDLGAASLSGYAVLHVTGFTGTPRLRISYACYPEESVLSEEGDYGTYMRGCYMGRDTEIPVLPANVNRRELYTISRTGTILAPMLMPQARYARVQLDTEGEVSLDGIEWFVGDTYDRQPLAGYFKSSDPDLDLHWQMGVWTAQFCTLNDVDAWRAIDGWLLPRRLEKGKEVGLSRQAFDLPSGSLETVFETRIAPDMYAEAGLALFASDPDNALLLSLDEGGVLRFIRRLNGRDNPLLETRLEDVRLVDCRPYRLGVRFAPMKKKLFLSRGTEITVSLDGRDVCMFDYYHNRQGAKFGFWTPKSRWPIFDSVTLKDGAGKTVFADGFDDAKLANWDFERPLPFVADGAKRDRLIWSGDLWWAGRNLYYGVTDQYGMRDSLKLLAFNQTPEGYVHACPYSEGAKPKAGDWGMFESDEFAAWFVPVLWDYYLYTGDDATLRELFPALEKLMDYLKPFVGKDGIFEPRYETSKHAFSAGLQAGDVRHRAYMDILLYECWKDAARMAEAMGRADRAAEWAQTAVATREAVNRMYWDEKGGCFRGTLEDWEYGWDNDAMRCFKKGAAAFGMEANAFALASGLATEEQAARFAKRIAGNTEVVKFVVMGARGKADYGWGDDAWQMIATNGWRVLTQPGWEGPLCSQEGMNVDFHLGCGDQSHPDTALAGFISGSFLGVVPTEPGFRAFRFAPVPYAKLTFAEGRVPTPHGAVDARWERTAEGFRMEFAVPDGTSAEVVAPPGSKVAEVDGRPFGGERLAPGRHTVRCVKAEGSSARTPCGWVPSGEVAVVAEGTGETFSYAADEAVRLLGRAGVKSAKRTEAGAPKAWTLRLGGRQAAPDVSGVKDDGFAVSVDATGAVISAPTEKGVLNGVYALAEAAGFAFVYPTEAGELLPEALAPIPFGTRVENPRFPHRGIIEASYAKIHYDFPQWMEFLAKLRFNACFNHITDEPRLVALCRRLGFRREYGGHEMSRRIDRTLFEKKPELFRMFQPEDFNGRRQGDSNFCVTNPETRERFKKGYVDWVRPHAAAGCTAVHAWADDLPGGGWCMCPRCRALSSADQSQMAMNLEAQAVREAGLDLRVPALAYHDTLFPSEAIEPDPLCFLLWAPRERCYAHAINDPDCALNREHLRGLEAWARRYARNTDAHTFEYYNDTMLFRGHMPYLPDQLVGDAEAYERNGIQSWMSIQIGGPILAPDWNMLAFSRLAWSRGLTAAAVTEGIVNGFPRADRAFWRQYLGMRAAIYATAFRVCDVPRTAYFDYRFMPEIGGETGRRMIANLEKGLALHREACAALDAAKLGSADSVRFAEMERKRVLHETTDLAAMVEHQKALYEVAEWNSSSDDAHLRKACDHFRATLPLLDRALAEMRPLVLQPGENDSAGGFSTCYYLTIGNWLKREIKGKLRVYEGRP